MSERHSVSVAAVIENLDPLNHEFLAAGILLVTQTPTGLVGLPAGHLELEVPFDGILREVREETGLTVRDVRWRRTPAIHTLVSEEKASVGILYSGKTTKYIPQRGYAMHSEEISYVRPFLLPELIELVNDPSKLYKPGFNRAFISAVLMTYLRDLTVLTKDIHEIARSWGIPKEYFKLAIG